MRVDYELLRAICPQGNREIMNALDEPLTLYTGQYEINTPLRLAHFLAQCAHETDGFRALEEYASGAGYEGRKDLGNVRPGDGKRYKGRGIFMLTGRSNYQAYGKRLGIDLVNKPELAKQPGTSVRVACEYWKAKGLNKWADRDDIREITRRINGGYNGLSDRQTYYDRCVAAMERLRPDQGPIHVSRTAVPVEEVPDAPIAAEPTVSAATSPSVWAGGIATAVLTGLTSINNHWQVIGLAVIVSVGVTGYLVWRHWEREKLTKPTITPEEQ